MKDLHARVPIDATAKRVVSSGTRYEVPKAALTTEVVSDTPLPTRPVKDGVDLTGVVFGYLTVVGLSSDRNGRWVCRCVCGQYCYRRARSMRSATDSPPACPKCCHGFHLQRVSHYISTGQWPQERSGGIREDFEVWIRQQRKDGGV